MSIVLNKSAGILVRLLQPVNVSLNILVVSVADDVSMPLNNPAGILVMPVRANVLLNIPLVFVADDVSIVLNKSAGILVKPVHPSNVPTNI